MLEFSIYFWFLRISIRVEWHGRDIQTLKQVALWSPLQVWKIFYITLIIYWIRCLWLQSNWPWEVTVVWRLCTLAGSMVAGEAFVMQDSETLYKVPYAWGLFGQTMNGQKKFTNNINKSKPQSRIGVNVPAGSKYQNTRINVKTECQGKGPKIDQIKARQGQTQESIHKNMAQSSQNCQGNCKASRGSSSSYALILQFNRTKETPPKKRG